MNTNKESIWTQGLLIDLDINWWKGFVKLDAKDIDADEGKVIHDVIYLGKKRLLESNVFSPFQTIENKSRIELERNSYKFMEHAIRFVPFSRLDSIIELFKGLKREFNLNTQLFFIEYQNNKAAFANKYPDLFEKNRDKYPTQNEIEYKFSYSWSMTEMQMPTEVKSQFISESQKELLQEEYRLNKEKVNEKLDDWVKIVSLQMKREIIEACKSLEDKIQDGKILRTNTLSATRETIDRIKSMNFIGDGEVDEVIERLKNKIPDENSRNIESIVNSFSETLEEIISDVKVDTTSTGSIKRSFVI